MVEVSEFVELAKQAETPIQMHAVCKEILAAGDQALYLQVYSGLYNLPEEKLEKQLANREQSKRLRYAWNALRLTQVHEAGNTELFAQQYDQIDTLERKAVAHHLNQIGRRDVAEAVRNQGVDPRWVHHNGQSTLADPRILDLVAT